MRTHRKPVFHDGVEATREEFLMAAADEVPWGMLAAVAGGVLAFEIVRRGVKSAVRIALGEARYRVDDPDTLLSWILK